MSTRVNPLLLLLLASCACGQALAQHAASGAAQAGDIVKCVKDGKVTYTNGRCDSGSQKQEVDLQPTEGFAPPPREAIERAASRLAAERAQENTAAPARVIGSPPPTPAPETVTEYRSDPYFYPYPYPVAPPQTDPCAWARRHPETNTRTAGCGPSAQRPADFPRHQRQESERRRNAPSAGARLKTD